MALTDVIAEVRRLVQDEPWEDYLSSSYSIGGTQVSVVKPASWEEGDTMDFDDATFEQFRVKADGTTNPLSIKFGHNGTTNANHASGATVLKNPTYGSDQISKAATHIIDTKLWPDVWVVAETTITPNPTSVIYDLPADYEDFVAMSQVSYSTIEDLDLMGPVRELLNVPTAVSASNKALRILGWPRMDVAATLFYRTRVTVTNLPDAMETMVALGTASYLKRTEMVSKDDRPDQDDRPGRMYRSGRELERLFIEERRSIRSQLMARWGGVRRFRHA